MYIATFLVNKDVGLYINIYNFIRHKDRKYKRIKDKNSTK